MQSLLSAITALPLCALLLARPASADLRVGDEAKLFTSVDENLRPVDMAGLVDGRPLVLVVGSCS